jgi:GNAT superfamily N-acetyltransferase
LEKDGQQSQGGETSHEIYVGRIESNPILLIFISYIDSFWKQGNEAMIEENLQKMITLADEFFQAKNDPMQISVDEKTRTKLKKIHPSTMAEIRNKKGPIAWILVIPTTITLMQQFVDKTIHERDLLQKTPLRAKYEAIYLCSALVLPEYRGKGLAKRLVSKSIRSIRKQHPIKYLFYWAFSKEGRNLARLAAKEFDLPLLSRDE